MIRFKCNVCATEGESESGSSPPGWRVFMLMELPQPVATGNVVNQPPPAPRQVMLHTCKQECADTLAGGVLSVLKEKPEPAATS